MVTDTVCVCPFRITVNFAVCPGRVCSSKYEQVVGVGYSCAVDGDYDVAADDDG